MASKKDYDNDDYSEAEWNSNKFIILRIHQTVLRIRQAKRLSDINEAIEDITDFYADISPKLSKPEKEIWNGIKAIKYLNVKVPVGNFVMYNQCSSNNRIWPLIDEVMLKLIEYADNHNLWMSEKDDLDGL